MISRQEFDTIRAALQWWGTFTSVLPADLDRHDEAEKISWEHGDPLRGDEVLTLRERLEIQAETLKPARIFMWAGVRYRVDEDALSSAPPDWRVIIWQFPAAEVQSTSLNLLEMVQHPFEGRGVIRRVRTIAWQAIFPDKACYNGPDFESCLEHLLDGAARVHQGNAESLVRDLYESEGAYSWRVPAALKHLLENKIVHPVEQ